MISHTLHTWFRAHATTVAFPLWRRPNRLSDPRRVLDLPRPVRGKITALRSDPRPVGHIVALVTAAALWLIGLWGADPRAMTDLGLVSLLSWPSYVALLVLVISFVAALATRAREPLLGAHLITLIFFFHGTPAVLFGTPRYGYLWKHLGIIDYILRHGRVDLHIKSLGVYHEWPGFFGASALLAQLAGPDNIYMIAMWATVFFNIANLLALRLLFRTFTTDRVRIWLALLLFFITTWVGQDYFSPQAFAFVLYLVVLALVLRHWRRGSGARVARRRRLLLVMVTVMIVAIAMSHQITPVIMVLTLTVLVVGRQVRGWYLPVIALLAGGIWALTVARQFMLSNLDLIELGNPMGNAAGTLAQSATIRGAQHLVSLAGRSVIVVISITACVGVLRLARRRQLDRAAALLLPTSGLLLLMTGYDGEVLFRVFLFASPLLSYFAAAALTVTGAGQQRRAVSALPMLLLSILLLPGFLLAYYGKDQQNYFTPEEVSAGAWIADHSVPDTLLVYGNANYPHDFRNYENVIEVEMDLQPDFPSIAANPATLADWLADPRYRRAYILITRSEILVEDATGPLPVGSLQQLENELVSSSRFTQVYHNRDASVFELADTSS